MRTAVYTLALGVISFVISGCTPVHYQRLCFSGSCVKVELAVFAEEKAIGLMYRDKLEYIGGMLFVLDERDSHSFWMKNVRFPLDMIWIDKRKKILHIDEDVPVCSNDCPGITFDGPVRYVLEAPAGFSKERKLKVGDVLKF